MFAAHAPGHGRYPQFVDEPINTKWNERSPTAMVHAIFPSAQYYHDREMSIYYSCFGCFFSVAVVYWRLQICSNVWALLKAHLPCGWEMSGPIAGSVQSDRGKRTRGVVRSSGDKPQSSKRPREGAGGIAQASVVWFYAPVRPQALSWCVPTCSSAHSWCCHSARIMWLAGIESIWYWCRQHGTSTGKHYEAILRTHCHM